MRIYFFIAMQIIVAQCVGQTGKFSYQYHNQSAKAGTFVFNDPAGIFGFSCPASAGYLGAANNPWLQLSKETGPIPNGTWEIYQLKNEAKSILRLRPTSDVNMPTDSAGRPIRDGFLIHGVNEGETPDEASRGCIILAPMYRKMLVGAFKKYGTLRVSVSNIVTGDPSN